MGGTQRRSKSICYLLIYEEARSVMVGVFERLALRSYCRSALVRCSMADRSKSYEDAIKTLNTLQSNAATIEKIRATRDQNCHQNIPDMISMTGRVGVTVDDIDDLRVIHVSGTKGKGSTCAFVESILRSLGFRTGFYSSPHLVEVRERIRINGRPLSCSDFTRYFWHNYRLLDASKSEHGGAMPAYFRFLTIMAFHVFIQEKVDVAIVEVGIGGQYDCTNIVRNPIVCGVTSLGIDHTGMLGDTLDKIAWHKAGIFKPNVPAVSVQQPKDGMEVLKDRAKEIGCPLFLAPNLDAYDWKSRCVELGIPGVHQQWNASLALQLSHFWIKDHKLGIVDRQTFYRDWRGGDGDHDSLVNGQYLTVSDAMAAGLHKCVWPARSQKLSGPGITYYLDGAHTTESLQLCADWYNVETSKEAKSLSENRFVRVLLFNMTGDRKPESLLRCLLSCNFDCAIFCPNILSRSKHSSDLTNLTVTEKSQTQRCEENRRIWLQLHSEYSQTNASFLNVSRSSHSFQDHKKINGSLDLDKSDDPFILSSNNEASLMPVFAFGTILESLFFVSRGQDPRIKVPSDLGIGTLPPCLQVAHHAQVLCVGSLHLVGGILSILDPTVCES